MKTLTARSRAGRNKPTSSRSEKPVSTSAFALPIAQALRALEAPIWEAEGKSPKPLAWKAINPDQQTAVTTLAALRSEHKKFANNELQGVGGNDAAVLNRILEEWGWDIRLTPFNPQEVGAVAQIDVKVEWVKPGVEDAIWIKDAKFPAFKLSRGVTFFKRAGLKTGVQLETVSGDLFFAEPFEGQPPSGLGLIEYAKSFATSTISPLDGHRYDNSVVLPCIDYHEEVDSDWLKKMETRAVRRWEISQAKQQSSFRMNRFGARGKSGVAIAATTLSARPAPLVFNKPFIAVTIRPGVSVPLFVTYLGYDSWKEPKEL